MKVFLSWSGTRSSKLANEMGTYLQCMIPGLTTFYSPRDIASGEPWHERVRDALADCDFGLLCVTTENIDSHWMLFEAGALAHNLGNRVCAVLFDGLNPGDLPKPLAGFQHRRFDRDNIWLLATHMCRASGPINDKILRMTFEKWWEDLGAACRVHEEGSEELRRGRQRVLGQLWVRERDSSDIWVFSPELYHDLFNPECKSVVKHNQAKGTTYRYIVPDTPTIADRMETYSREYGLDTVSMKDVFMPISIDEELMTKFLIEVVIYDPHKPGRFVAGYHPSSHQSEDDIICFSKYVSDHFLTTFQQVWTKGKGALP